MQARDIAGILPGYEYPGVFNALRRYTRLQGAPYTRRHGAYHSDALRHVSRHIQSMTGPLDTAKCGKALAEILPDPDYLVI